MAKNVKDKPHYVNNRDFSGAVVEYVKSVNAAKLNGTPIPIVTNYIAQSFLRISEGLSHKGNFIRYTYREEMVMDAVENCLKAINNYNIDTVTRTGKPNAFSYFTQISWYAFLRRIAKEKKQYDLKLKYMKHAGISEMVETSENGESQNAESYFVDTLISRIENMHDHGTPKSSPEQTAEELKKSLENFMG